MKKTSSKKGITLIALIITIIVLLILARSELKCNNRR
jgi:Tfp pilus assembly protein PilE